MKRISVELVPRDEDALRGELALLGKFKEQVDVINIPDLLRFPTRSWQGAAIAKEYFAESMPHIRAASTPSCVVLLPVTCQPRAVNDSASGSPSHPKPTIATFFIPGS